MDYKQVGGGAAAGGGLMAILLALFQQQGVDLMAQRYIAENKIAVERSASNTERLNRLETRIDRGFDEIKIQVDKVGDAVREGIKSRWTKLDHDSYARRIDLRIERLEDQVLILKTKQMSIKDKGE